jgi:hypothetical protein
VSEDPILRLAQQRAITNSADIEAQLSVVQGCRPVLAILVKARQKAAAALTALAFIDVDKPKDIQALQNEVRRYDDLVRFVDEIVREGIQADAEITAQDREEMIDLLSQTPEGQQEAEQLGLIDQVPHDA